MLGKRTSGKAGKETGNVIIRFAAFYETWKDTFISIRNERNAKTIKDGQEKKYKQIFYDTNKFVYILDEVFEEKVKKEAERFSGNIETILGNFQNAQLKRKVKVQSVAPAAYLEKILNAGFPQSFPNEKAADSNKASAQDIATVLHNIFKGDHDVQSLLYGKPKLAYKKNGFTKIHGIRDTDNLVTKFDKVINAAPTVKIIDDNSKLKTLVDKIKGSFTLIEEEVKNKGGDQASIKSINEMVVETRKYFKGEFNKFFGACQRRSLAMKKNASSKFQKSLNALKTALNNGGGFLTKNTVPEAEINLINVLKKNRLSILGLGNKRVIAAKKMEKARNKVIKHFDAAPAGPPAEEPAVVENMAQQEDAGAGELNSK
jgi:hypothetical protein